MKPLRSVALRSGVALALACQGPAHSPKPNAVTARLTPSASTCRPAAPLRVAPAAPLPQQPRRLWTKALGWRGLQPGGPVATKQRLAVSTANRLFIIDQVGAVVASVQAQREHEVMSAPTSDAAGNLYFAAGARLYSATDEGKPRWSTADTPGMGASPASPPLLSPDGVVYVIGGDGKLIAARSEDGKLLWANDAEPSSLALGFTRSGRGWVVANSPLRGSTLFAAFDGSRQDTAKSRPGAPIFAKLVGGSTGLLGFSIADSSSSARSTLHTLSFCGDSATTTLVDAQPSLLLPNDDVVVTSHARDDSPAFTIRSMTERGGAPTTRSAVGVPIAIGADDSIFALSCDATTGPSRLDVYGVDLSRRYSVELGLGCPAARPILQPDGKLFLVRERPDVGVEVIAVQTSSPGLATRGWPVARHDSQGTSWSAL